MARTLKVGHLLSVLWRQREILAALGDAGQRSAEAEKACDAIDTLAQVLFQGEQLDVLPQDLPAEVLDDLVVSIAEMTLTTQAVIGEELIRVLGKSDPSEEA